MDEEILRLAAAPTTRGLVRELAGRLHDADPVALAEEAFSDGELRASLNIALAGAIDGRPPPGDLAARLFPVNENTDLGIRLFTAVKRGRLDGLLESYRYGAHPARRLGLLLYLAAVNLDGREPPGELKTRIRLTARHEYCTDDAAIFVGLAAKIVDDPDVTKVARDCVAAADSALGRRLERITREILDRPLIEVIPEEALDLHGGFTVKRTAPRVGRNDPCPCGSGKKYKRCCLDRTADSAPTVNPGQPWGERARQHRAMSDEQFDSLIPVELARIPPAELPTPRLLAAFRRMTELQAVNLVLPLVEEVVTRTDLPDDVTPLSIREEALQGAIAARDLDLVDTLLEGVDDPETLREHLHVSLAIVRRDPDQLDRLEAMAERALREEDEDLLGRLRGIALYFTPALGVLLCRGDIDVEDPEGMEVGLGLIEEARDLLLLPPNDPLWEIYDAVSERMLEARAERSAVEENEELSAELEEIRRTLAISGARERESRRELDRRRRLVNDLAAAVVKAKDTKRGDGNATEALSNARRELEAKRVEIKAGNEKRRRLREEVRRLSSRLDAASAEDAEEEADDGLEAEAVPERLTPRVPTFMKGFVDGLDDVEAPVSRAAIAMACRLAAADAGAWSSVKSIKALPGVFSRRIGRRRLLFRLDGERGIEMVRVLHRRDLETVIRKMGG